jgi:hypothetical protein
MNNTKEEVEQRYRQRYMYGRYEVIDTLSDRQICYGFNSEEIDNIVSAMNVQWLTDKEESHG